MCLRSSLLSFLLLSFLVGCGNSGDSEGDTYFASGEYEKAIQAYSDYIAIPPSHVKSIYNRGRAYEELGQLDNAMADYERVLKIDPKNQNAYLSVGQLYYNEGDFDNALFYFDNAIKEGRSNAQAFVLRGRANHKLGNTDEAMEDYSAAISVDSQNGEAYLYRGALRVAHKKINSGWQALKKALALKVPAAADAVEKYCPSSLTWLHSCCVAKEPRPSHCGQAVKVVLSPWQT